MLFKPLKPMIAIAIVVTSLAAPVPVLAGSLGSALLGGIIGGAIVSGVNNNNRRQVHRNAVSSATRQQNREVQTSLNYFGFPAGSPDGVLGRKSRTATSQYQAFMGFPATGKLTQYERDFLVSSYDRAHIGGPQVIQAMQSNPQGTRSLLLVWRDEATGMRSASVGYGGMPAEVSKAIAEIAASSDPSADQLMQRAGFIQIADLNGDGKNDYVLDTSVTGSSFWCGDSQCSVLVFASTPKGYVRNDFLSRDASPAMFSCRQGVCRINSQGDVTVATAGAPTPQAPAQQPRATVMASATSAAPAQSLGGIKPFAMVGQAPTEASLTSLCSKVSLLTNSNGGYVTAASMSDPDLALSEQFCLARSYAIGTGENMVAKVQGLTPAQVDAQCDSFGPALKPFVISLADTAANQVRSNVQAFVLQSNMSLEQLANTARICMFSGYRRDRMDVALGSALLMVGVGRTPYAELVGHHLSKGYGVSASIPLAQDWYAMAVNALESGAEPAFAPGQPERTGLIKAAALALGGGEHNLPVAQPASLPSFSLE